MHPFPPDQFNLAEYVLSAGDGDKTALTVVSSPPKSWTYDKLRRDVGRAAVRFQELGARPGDRILLRIGHDPICPISFLAAISIGSVPIMTSALLTQAEVEATLQQLCPKLAVVSRSLAVTLPEAVGHVFAEDLLATDLNVSVPYHKGHEDRPAYIVYTSGTSGTPRAVEHAHRAIRARRMMFDDWYGLTPNDRVLHAGAFNWTYTLGTGLLDPWTIGATAYVLPDPRDMVELSRALTAHQISIFAASPAVYRRLLKGDLKTGSSLRHGLSAGEKMPDNTMKAWRDMTGLSVFEAFGMSECSTFISSSPSRPAPHGTLGYPQRGRKVSLRGPDTPEHGTIAIHKTDPGLMLGYVDDPDATNARFDGPWFLTGDLGSRDTSGAITYAGRTDDQMNAGGVRVSPIEVERALADAPGLSDVACAEVRLSQDLSLIAAFYTAPKVIDDHVLKMHAATRLADFKVPRIFVRVDQLPRGANNKLLRRELRRSWEAEHGET